jgi:hypothetical protein
MRTGQRDQLVHFYRKTITGQDSYGQDILGTPTDLGEAWATVRWLAGGEAQRLQQRWAEARYSLNIRPMDSTLKPSDYATWNEQTLELLDVQGPGSRAREWIIIAKDYIE